MTETVQVDMTGILDSQTAVDLFVFPGNSVFGDPSPVEDDSNSRQINDPQTDWVSEQIRAYDRFLGFLMSGDIESALVASKLVTAQDLVESALTTFGKNNKHLSAA